MTGQGKQKGKIIPDYFTKTSSATSALIFSNRSSKLSSIFSESISQIPPIIKNVFTASEIRIAGLDITTHTNHNFSTPIILRRIGQFPVVHQPQRSVLVDVDQAVIDR